MCQPNTGRRQFLGGLLAAGVVPQMSWADAGSPAFLSAAAKRDGSFVLCGIGEDLSIRFGLPLPARGHAAAAHPTRPEAVAFARRPGTFAVVIDCVTGAQKAMLASPEGRHFNGHGVFSSDGDLLFTTENDFEAGRGRIGVWDTRHGYARIAEWDSGGIGPHDIKRLPGTDTLVVANGGIDTHPDTGRTKLNIATMEPNIAYIKDGDALEITSLPDEMHKNSIRHLAVSDEGQVAFGMQWQGDGAVETLVGIHNMEQPIRLMSAQGNDVRRMEGYIGSIAITPDGLTIAVTSPRGGELQIFDVATAQLKQVDALEDVCGVVAVDGNFVMSTGLGKLRYHGTTTASLSDTAFAWDNHLIRI